MNMSYNEQKGTLRGLHYQHAPHAEIKLVGCIQGAIFDVIVDMGTGSPTYLEWRGFLLNASEIRCMFRRDSRTDCRRSKTIARSCIRSRNFMRRDTNREFA